MPDVIEKLNLSKKRSVDINPALHSTVEAWVKRYFERSVVYFDIFHAMRSKSIQCSAKLKLRPILLKGPSLQSVDAVIRRDKCPGLPADKFCAKVGCIPMYCSDLYELHTYVASVV